MTVGEELIQLDEDDDVTEPSSKRVKNEDVSVKVDEVIKKLDGCR